MEQYPSPYCGDLVLFPNSILNPHGTWKPPTLRISFVWKWLLQWLGFFVMIAGFQAGSRSTTGLDRPEKIYIYRRCALMGHVCVCVFKLNKQGRFYYDDFPSMGTNSKV